MANKRYEDFIYKLLEETKLRQLNWSFLDTNIPLCKGMGWLSSPYNNIAIIASVITESKITFKFDTDNSYYVSISDNTFVVLLSPLDSDIPQLYVIPNGFKKTVQLSPQEYGIPITRLANIVSNQFPSGDQAISEFLNQE